MEPDYINCLSFMKDSNYELTSIEVFKHNDDLEDDTDVIFLDLSLVSEASFSPEEACIKFDMAPGIDAFEDVLISYSGEARLRYTYTTVNGSRFTSMGAITYESFEVKDGKFVFYFIVEDFFYNEDARLPTEYFTKKEDL